jgi:UDP-glucose 4-epimerase
MRCTSLLDDSMTFLLTGATGHLGSSLTRRLVEHGEDVSIVVRKESDLWRLADVIDRVRIYHADLEDAAAMSKALAQSRPGTLVHLAWDGVSSDSRNDSAQVTSNVCGTLKLFEAAQAHGCQCWIGIGSQAEYGPYDGPLHEELPPRPVTAYGVAKLCIGLLTKKLCELNGMRYVWLRLLAVYGPQDDGRHFIPSVINQLLRGEKPALTPGEQEWDYLYVDDAAEAIHLAAVKPEVKGVYNLGSGKVQNIRHIAERLRDMIDPTLPLGFGELAYQPDQLMHLQADIARIQMATGWSPQTTLEEGLQRTVAWHRAVLKS